ncbi:hypothetical protein [Kitasatospora nipponensis]|uniref:hypothetical protein n=1 Tax=Kitasatospora nipponensis TaxID=258049 RepID=UPI0031D8A987
MTFAGVLACLALQGRDGAGYAERGPTLAAATGVVLPAIRTHGLLVPRSDAPEPSVGQGL